MIERAVTVFPLPLSPTMPIESPLSTSKSIPLTAFTSPKRVENLVCSPFTSSSFSDTHHTSGSSSISRVHGVPCSVAYEIKRHHGQANRSRRKKELISVKPYSIDGVACKRSPRSLRRRNSQTYEAEKSLCKDCARYHGGHRHNYRTRRVWNQVPCHYPPPCGSRYSRRCYIVLLLEGKDLPPYDSCHVNPIDHSHGQYDGSYSVTYHNRQEYDIKDHGNCARHVHKPHHNIIRPASSQTRNTSVKHPY